MILEDVQRKRFGANKSVTVRSRTDELAALQCACCRWRWWDAAGTAIQIAKFGVRSTECWSAAIGATRIACWSAVQTDTCAASWSAETADTFAEGLTVRPAAMCTASFPGAAGAIRTASWSCPGR